MSLRQSLFHQDFDAAHAFNRVDTRCAYYREQAVELSIWLSMGLKL